MHTTQADLRDGRQRRRRHSEEFKAHVVAECARPGVSIAAIALHHGLNANLLRRWVAQAGVIGEEVSPLRPPPPQQHQSGSALAAFVPVAIAAQPDALVGGIEIEIKRGAMSVSISWPLSAAPECSAWLREWLR